MRISDWSSDVCSSDLQGDDGVAKVGVALDLVGQRVAGRDDDARQPRGVELRSEEHTSELQSLMRHSYAVFCLKTQISQLIRTISPLHHTQAHHQLRYN